MPKSRNSHNFLKHSNEFNVVLILICKNVNSITPGLKIKFNFIIKLFRLYFLSNNELLEMLSKARNPEDIQAYLFKMFSSVARLECKNRFEITAVYSERGEKFKLSKPININHFKRHVDKWLAELVKFFFKIDQNINLFPKNSNTKKLYLGT